MLTDKQSLLLCAFIVIGFVVGGIFDLLETYLVTGILSVAFILVLLNIVIANPFKEKDQDE
ncbi:MAG TPA: hypothetical protein VFF15_03815 [Flavobacteriaceae bacterium]|nr:hypothetical protein [Flavobacteriaceae bacterium]